MAVPPIGSIIYWPGSAGSIPAGWQLCDGTNGTPDLRDRFVPGAGGAYAVGDAGGYADVQIPAHIHAESSPSTYNPGFFAPHRFYGDKHYHQTDGLTTGSASSSSSIITDPTIFYDTDDGADHTHNLRAGTGYIYLNDFLSGFPIGDQHQHTGSGAYASSGPEDGPNQEPSYIGLYFIQRLS